MDRPDEILSCHVCVNVTCAFFGSEQMAEALTAQIDGTGVEVKRVICFGGCDTAPNIVLHPKGTWYSRVQPNDIDDIVAHIKGGEPVTRLIGPIDPKLYELIMSLMDLGLD